MKNEKWLSTYLESDTDFEGELRVRLDEVELDIGRVVGASGIIVAVEGQHAHRDGGVETCRTTYQLGKIGETNWDNLSWTTTVPSMDHP